MTTKKEHPQAKWLRAIADGETIQDNNTPMGTYVDMPQETILWRLANGGNTESLRINPRTITIGRYEVPEPMRVAPKEGTRYFYFSTTEIGDYDRRNDVIDKEILKSNRAWLKKADVELAYKAITELLAGVCSESD